MSTSPIGTRVSTLSPNSIIRAGIPLSDDFNATDVAVSVESLLAMIPGGVTVSSGTWTPTLGSFNNAITDATLQNASYVRVGNFVTCYIRLSIDFDFSLVDVGNLQFSYPFASTSNDGGGVVNGQNFYFSLNGQVDGTQMLFYSADTSLVYTGTFQAIFQYEIV